MEAESYRLNFCDTNIGMDYASVHMFHITEWAMQTIAFVGTGIPEVIVASDVNGRVVLLNQVFCFKYDFQGESDTFPRPPDLFIFAWNVSIM